MTSDISEILFDEQQLKIIVDNIAEKINSDYKNQELVVIGVLNGSVIFLADLFRKLDLLCLLDFMSVSSYESGTTSNGNPKITKDLLTNVTGKNVLIVEDILDTGNTLSYIKEYILSKNPLSVKLCVLFDKPDRRKKYITPDYIGKVVPDYFIVGYGLDYNGKYRNLPYVGILKEEIYFKSDKTKE